LCGEIAQLGKSGVESPFLVDQVGLSTEIVQSNGGPLLFDIGQSLANSLNLICKRLRGHFNLLWPTQYPPGTPSKPRAPKPTRGAMILIA
jgi:hypothetical protein